jgi:DNA repair exonuclease SbcCD ATPase subunit
MSNASSTAAPDADPATTTTTEAKPDVVDVEALKAAAAELTQLKAKLAEDKAAEREARKRAQAEAERNGELAKALEAAKARLAELEPLEPLAHRWRAHEQAESKRLDDEAASLPEAVRALYARATDIDSKREVLDAFRAVAPTTTQTKQVPPSIGAPASVTSVDVEEALKDKTGKKLAEIKARDPGAVSQFFASLLGGGRKSNSLGVGRLTSTSTPKAPNA